MPAPGSWLAGRWLLKGVLGQGGMGTVFEARHRTGRRVAIKVLRRDLAADEDTLRRFAREAYLANVVGHPGVVSVLDDGMTSDGLPFLVLEFLEGETLGARLRRLGETMELPDVLAMAVALLDTLAAAHEKGVIHRDLKPGNVFLTTDGGVKTLDFGAARLDTARGRNVTEAGVVLGTPTFMPCEQALGLGAEVNGQSDLWSLAATLFFALSGEYVHPYESEAAFLYRLVTSPASRLREVAPSVPAPIAAVIDCALEMSKARRWPSAVAMKQALLAAARQCAVTIPPRVGSPLTVTRATTRLSLDDIPRDLPIRSTRRLPSPWLGDDPTDGVSDEQAAVASVPVILAAPPMPPRVSPDATTLKPPPSEASPDPQRSQPASARGRPGLLPAFELLLALGLACVMISVGSLASWKHAAASSPAAPPASVFQVRALPPPSVPAPVVTAPVVAASGPSTAKPRRPRAPTPAELGASRY